MVSFVKNGLPAALLEAEEELEPAGSSNIQSRQNLCGTQHQILDQNFDCINIFKFFSTARMGDIGKQEKTPMSVIRLNRFNWPRQASLDMAGSARIDELAMQKMMTKYVSCCSS